MRRLLLAAVVALALSFAGSEGAYAEDSVRISRNSALIGEQLRMDIEVLVPAGATVELTPGTPSWGSVELAGVDEITQVQRSDGVLWLISARIAGFTPGAVAFAPTVTVVQGAEASSRQLPAVELTVVPALPTDAELVLSPMPPPVAIEGAESPLLKPALVAGGIAGAALLALLAWMVGRFLSQRMGRRPAPAEAAEIPASLEGAEKLLHVDPVGAYRLMSVVVKTELARRYGVRATALTSTELRRKLDAGGERWQARLVGGLLDECDSVIYAGYRPAAERREADLTMAREIVEVPA